MASSIVSSAAKQLGTLLVQEAKYLYRVSDNIKNLQSELKWIQCFLKDADNMEHREEVVRMWVAEIRDFAYEAEDVIERYVHQVSRPRKNGILNAIKWFSCVRGDALTLHDIGSSMDDLSRKITKLISRLQMYGIQIIRQPENSTYNSTMREQRRTYSHVEEKTVGLEKHITELVHKLVDEKEVKVVGVCGIGGLGKTTLVRKVYSHEKVKEYFNNCVWIYVSQQFETRNVFEEILIGLSSIEKDNDAIKKIKELPSGALPGKICEVLEEKKCLLLLDDMWATKAWDTLKPAFQSIKRGDSKILITTRNLELVQHADPSGYSHHLTILSEDDSWTLLQRTSFLEENNTDAKEKAKMEGLGKIMLKHCGGLPLAIVALGGILATKRTTHEWEIVSRNVSSYFNDMVGEGGGNDDAILTVLELSYQELPFYLKPCFMCLANFPEDYEIEADRLYHLWEAEGLVSVSADVHGVALDDIAGSYLDQLVNRSMVQVEGRWENGSIKSCRMHDVMRDMCLKKCREVNFLSVKEGGKFSLSDTKVRRCAFYWHDDGDDKSFNLDGYFFDEVDQNEAPYIRSIMVFCHRLPYTRWLVSLDTRKFISLLRVLDLENCMVRHAEEKVIATCIHLRYLSMRNCYMGDHSGIWDFKYLETLDLRVQGSMELRANAVQKLGRLRNLYLPERMCIRDGDKLRLALKQLEMVVNFDPSWCEAKDLGEMSNLRILSFTEVSMLLSSGFKRKDDMEHLLKSPFIETGQLKRSLNLIRIQADIINEEPTLLTSSSLNSPPQLDCIKELIITGSIHASTFGQLGDHQSVFPRSLTRLCLDGCGEIQKQCIMELEKLPHLKLLELRDASIRGSKMSFSDGCFKQLIWLHVVRMSNLEECEVGKGALSNLQYLGLYECQNLEEWGVGEGALPKLHYLDLRLSESLKRVPGNLPASLKILHHIHTNGIEKYKQATHDEMEGARGSLVYGSRGEGVMISPLLP